MGTWGWMGVLPLLWGLLLIQGARAQDGVTQKNDAGKPKLFSDKCNQTSECFEGAECSKGVCLCSPETPVTNHLDKCGKKAKVNETCFFSEQCEAETLQTECRDGTCVCRFQMQAITKPDGTQECLAPKPNFWISHYNDVNNSYGENQSLVGQEHIPEAVEALNTAVKQDYKPEKYIDPAMIGILVAMFLMFITICVVLRLFSRARWRENRTIFNTPNPRLMNVSLLRDSKLLHDRRGSRGSVRGPSRQPSMASLRPHSPNSQQGRLFLGSRRGSHGSSNASATSTRSNKSPPGHQANSSVTTPMLESVTVEIQDGRK